ncbi:hypothetical protein GW17_00061794 [Ensete ventricosum]|nr:hypothetical protein GW17_00061794 [Ensete ventricosum]
MTSPAAAVTAPCFPRHSIHCRCFAPIYHTPLKSAIFIHILLGSSGAGLLNYMEMPDDQMKLVDMINSRQTVIVLVLRCPTPIRSQHRQLLPLLLHLHNEAPASSTSPRPWRFREPPAETDAALPAYSGGR